VGDSYEPRGWNRVRVSEARDDQQSRVARADKVREATGVAGQRQFRIQRYGALAI